MRRGRRGRVLWGVSVCLLCVFAMELGVRVAGYQARMPFAPFMYENSDVLGWALAKNRVFFSERARGTMAYRSDEFGNRVPLKAALPEGAQVVYFIGDSYTYGWGVNFEDTFVFDVVQRASKEGLDVSIVNLGVPGYGTWQSLERLKAYVKSHGKPDQVFYLFSPNDPIDNMRGLKEVVWGIRMDKDLPFKPILALMGHSYHYSKLVSFVADRLMTYDRAAKKKALVASSYQSGVQPGHRLMDNLLGHLRDLKEWSDEQGVRLIIGETLASPFSESLRAFSQSRDIPFMSVEELEEIREMSYSDRLNPAPDFHWTAEVHQIFGKNLFSLLFDAR